ncbi:hypothetical protein IWX50DRAFT_623409 [Phyllosticta citricarpa]
MVDTRQHRQSARTSEEKDGGVAGFFFFFFLAGRREISRFGNGSWRREEQWDFCRAQHRAAISLIPNVDGPGAPEPLRKLRGHSTKRTTQEFLASMAPAVSRRLRAVNMAAGGWIHVACHVWQTEGVCAAPLHSLLSSPCLADHGPWTMGAGRPVGSAACGYSPLG